MESVKKQNVPQEFQNLKDEIVEALDKTPTEVSYSQYDRTGNYRVSLIMESDVTHLSIATELPEEINVRKINSVSSEFFEMTLVNSESGNRVRLKFLQK